MVGTKDVLVWLVKLAGPKPNFTIVIGAVVVAVALVALIIVLRIQRHKPKKQPTANFSHF
jgi:ABC-type spermidine/putrescine transport system permease subunit II